MKDHWINGSFQTYVFKDIFLIRKNAVEQHLNGFCLPMVGPLDTPQFWLSS
jgi:hypothetical protein